MMGTVSHILDRKGREVWSTTPESTVEEALRLMAEKGIGDVVRAVIDEQEFTIRELEAFVDEVLLTGEKSGASG